MKYKCSMCPHKCLVDRIENFGYCKAGKNIKLAKVCMHYCEEPCISGFNNINNIEELNNNDIKRGSGAIFFSNCNMKCIFCQNKKISQDGFGKEISNEKLSKIMLKLQENGAYNINLVTPTIYVENIVESLKLAKQKGLKIPVIYNSGGYENIESLKKLDGLIDVYLPDFKYFNNDIAYEYSKIRNYFEYACKTIQEMYRQVGNPIFDENGLIKKGMIIRHLILPNNTRDSKKILKWINDNLNNEVYISLMAQYFPTENVKKHDKLNRGITKKELKLVEKYMYDLGFSNGYVQKVGKNEEEYVPDFNLEGID